MSVLSPPLEAQRLLPHRGRMCCIDELVSLAASEAEATALLRPGHVLLDGQGFMDPCGFIELAAQTAGAMQGALTAGAAPDLAMLAGVQKVVVKGRARVGDRLRINVTLLGELEGMSSLQFIVSLETEEGPAEALAEGRLKVFVPETSASAGLS